ncbi:MAG: radical SAM protein [Deferribacterota bacterium]|nr:radical SAM protein [Deferribacterota bacterium]
MAKTTNIKNKIYISEIFTSHQGEGILIGELMFFIRLSGCNLSCLWCDTKYANKEGKLLYIEEIVNKLKEVEWQKGRWICITGGEPLMQDNTYLLIKQLLELGYSILLETNGSYSIKNLINIDNLLISMDIKCPSSGEENNNRFSNINLLRVKDQLKFVINDERDFYYSQNIINKYNPRCSVIFQPQISYKSPAEFKWLFEKCKKEKIYAKIILQQHKIVFGEVRGV